IDESEPAAGGITSVSTSGGGMPVLGGLCGPGLQPGAAWAMLGRCQAHPGRSGVAGPLSPTQKWTYSAGGAIASSSAVAADGTIYFGSFDHKLYAIKSDGTERWAFATGGTVRSTPAIGADSTVYVGSD